MNTASASLYELYELPGDPATGSGAVLFVARHDTQPAPPPDSGHG